MATNNDTRLDVDEDEEAILRFWDAQVLKGMADSVIGRAIAARASSESGLAVKGKL
jgi:hypothetical protein